MASRLVQTDASTAPGVVEFRERLIREQLAPELYTLVQRLYRKAVWVDPQLVNDGDSVISAGLGQQHTRQVALRKAFVIAQYLAEKSSNDDDAMEEEGIGSRPLPLLPPHPCTDTFAFTPLLDFVKSVCEVCAYL